MADFGGVGNCLYGRRREPAFYEGDPRKGKPHFTCGGQPERFPKTDRHPVLRPKIKEQAMKLKIDKENDALYLRLDDSVIVESEEVQPGIILDFDANNRVVGIEILDLSTRVKPDMLKLVQLETV